MIFNRIFISKLVATSTLQFLQVEKQKRVYDTIAILALQFLQLKKRKQNEDKLAKLLINDAFHIFYRKVDISSNYRLHLIFWMGNNILAIGHTRICF